MTSDNLQQAPKILVCDDDMTVRLLARECLEGAGMTVVEACDGAEALEQYIAEQPDLIFLDVEMPGKTGLEVCEAIRSTEAGMTTPILLATGADDQESIDRGFSAGATQYKTKPINWSLLAKDIRYMLRAADAFRELKAQEDRLRHLAYFDHLTDLPNRRKFNEQLRETLLEADLSGQRTGLLVVNIDHFKRINDSIGHERGDGILRQVAERLCNLCQDFDATTNFSSSTIVARPGGDEFSLIVRGMTDGSALISLGKTIIETLAKPMRIEEHQLVITPSIGIAEAPEHATDPEILLRQADAAMRAAKADGRSQLRVYDNTLDDDAALKLRLEVDLRSAMAPGANQLEMVYQPQIDTASGRISGVETLIRWHHPELGMISPAQFIPVAESSGLIIPLGDWILRRVDQDTKAAGDRFPDNVAISINLSPLQFNQSNFVEHLHSTLFELDAKFDIELELTEGVIMGAAKDNLEKLRQLKEMGFLLAIDDFGTGYSSLSYLRQFPIDTLKIDRSFVNDLDTPDGQGIVRAILSLGHALGLRIVAEGIETREQADFLNTHGCTTLQGFLLARPLSVEKLLEVVDDDYSSLLTPAETPSSKP